MIEFNSEQYQSEFIERLISKFGFSNLEAFKQFESLEPSDYEDLSDPVSDADEYMSYWGD